MLLPGVREDHFERFLTEEYYPAWRLPGMHVSVLKGDRGDREGRYLHLIEFDNVETRDRYYPTYGTESEEVERWERETAAAHEKWSSFATAVLTAFTDYVVVGK